MITEVQPGGKTERVAVEEDREPDTHSYTLLESVSNDEDEKLAPTVPAAGQYSTLTKIDIATTPSDSSCASGWLVGEAW